MKKKKDDEIEINLDKVDWKFITILMAFIVTIIIILIPKFTLNITEQVNEWECNCNCNCEYEEREVKEEVYWNITKFNWTDRWPQIWVNSTYYNINYTFFNTTGNDLFPVWHDGWHNDCKWCMNINEQNMVYMREYKYINKS